MIVDVRELELVWPIVRDWIAAAMEYSISDTAEDWLKLVCVGKAQLWIFKSGSAVTRIVPGKTSNALQVVAVGGTDMHEWIRDAVSQWESYAARNGCASIVAVGRPGWKRSFKELGFEVHQLIALKPVNTNQLAKVA